MASALQLRAHLGTDHKANLKWIADQIMLFSEGGDVTKAILLNDGDGAREWMEATQMCLDSVDNLHPLRRPGMNLILRLAKLRNICPPSLLVPTGSRLEAFQWIWRGGGSANVHKGTYDHQQVVVKKVRSSESPEKRKLMLINALSEAIILRQLSHPNILQLIGVDAVAWIKDKEVDILSPQIGQVLEDFVLYPSHPPQPPRLAYDPATHRMPLLEDIAKAVQFLHSLELVHGDLNTNNILVSSQGRAIVADFGTAMHDKLSYDIGIPTETPGGTPGWQAPELMQEITPQWLAPSADIFAIGCVAYAILTGSFPWKDVRRAKENVKAGKMPPIPSDENSLPCNGPMPSAALRELIKRCWAFNPEDRPNITAVLKSLGLHTG